MLHKIQMGMTPDYLLGMIDSDGRERPAAPVIVSGDAELLKQVIAACPHKRKYTSGLLMEEKSLEQLGGRDFIQKLMDDFEEVMFPGLSKESYVMIWVVHPRLDKKLELNYCVANMHLPSGKSLKAYYDKADRKRFTLFAEQQNLRHGLSNPNDLHRRKSLRLNAKLPKEKERAIQLIHRSVKDAIEKGRVHDRESLLKFLGGTYEINRQGTDYISIRDSSGRLLRLKGTYYERGFMASEVGVSISNDAQKTKERLTFVNSELERLSSQRAEYLARRYKPITETTKNRQYNETTKPKRSLRRRILGVAIGIARGAQSLVRDFTGQNLAVGLNSHRSSGSNEGAIENSRIQDPTSLARDQACRRFRDSTSDSENRISSRVLDAEEHSGWRDDDISTSDDEVSLLASFFRRFSWHMHRFPGGGRVSEKSIDQDLQVGSPEVRGGER